jgi:hypothetical protein
MSEPSGLIYNGFHRLVFSIGLAMLIFSVCDFAGHKGESESYLKRFLSWGGFTVLSKFSYIMYLYHVTTVFFVWSLPPLNDHLSALGIYVKALQTYALSLIVVVPLYYLGQLIQNKVVKRFLL